MWIHLTRTLAGDTNPYADIKAIIATLVIGW